MSDISGTTATTGTAANTTTATAANTGLNQLDNTQTFLQLLVAQLQNQDPDNPTDPTAFMTEIAQMTQVQSQSSLSAEEQTVAADSMIGMQVSGTGANGTTLSGVVSGVLLSSSGAPELEVGTSSSSTPTDMAITSVTQVSQAPSSSTTASS